MTSSLCDCGTLLQTLKHIVEMRPTSRLLYRRGLPKLGSLDGRLFSARWLHFLTHSYSSVNDMKEDCHDSYIGPTPTLSAPCIYADISHTITFVLFIADLYGSNSLTPDALYGTTLTSLDDGRDVMDDLLHHHPSTASNMNSPGSTPEPGLIRPDPQPHR